MGRTIALRLSAEKTVENNASTCVSTVASLIRRIFCKFSDCKYETRVVRVTTRKVSLVREKASVTSGYSVRLVELELDRSIQFGYGMFYRISIH